MLSAFFPAVGFCYDVVTGPPLPEPETVYQKTEQSQIGSRVPASFHFVSKATSAGTGML